MPPKMHCMSFINDLKFGRFIPWGACSKPAGTWKGEKIPGLGEWIMYLGK